jgi:hypothetical protein
MCELLSKNEEVRGVAGNSQLPALNSRERFERRACRAATIRAVAIE